jgi:pyridoxine 5-phosphate synthase
MTHQTRLQVNIDHVATLRQARRAPYPDPVEAARLAEEAGASGITVHLRCDRRHIQDDDVRRLRASVRGRLNLELGTTEEMIAIALEVRPHQASLVPERPEEVTTEGGLDVLARGTEVAAAARRLAAKGIEVSVFLDPGPAQVRALAALGAPIKGFEINTDAYARAWLAAAPDHSTGATLPSTVASELTEVREAARLGAELGFRVYAGHALTSANVGPIAALPEIEELNIGHWLVARSLALGLAGAVEEMLRAMRSSG